uniref:Uncharacterized protein n=1 Tax=Romanomermis culicivorax TaxID=13658 RepID=A0A915KUX8_ROMCU
MKWLNESCGYKAHDEVLNLEAFYKEQTITTCVKKKSSDYLKHNNRKMARKCQESLFFALKCTLLDS